MTRIVTMLMISLATLFASSASELSTKYRFAVRLVEIVAEESKCELSIAKTLQDEEEAPFIVYLETEGDDCEEAVEVLNKRGKYPNFAFIALKPGVKTHDIPYVDPPLRRPKNYDLIHEIVD